MRAQDSIDTASCRSDVEKRRKLSLILRICTCVFLAGQQKYEGTSCRTQVRPSILCKNASEFQACPVHDAGCVQQIDEALNFDNATRRETRSDPGKCGGSMHRPTLSTHGSLSQARPTHPGVPYLHELHAVQVDGPHDGVRVVLDQPVLAHPLRLHTRTRHPPAFGGGTRGTERREAASRFACVLPLVYASPFHSLHKKNGRQLE